MIGGISGIGSLQFKPALDGADAGISPAQGGAASIGGSSFADLLNQAASRTVGTLQNAEQVSMQALKGDADTRQVVDAVMSAQQALQTAVAIRDKVVSAYLEISRMGI